MVDAHVAGDRDGTEALAALIIPEMRKATGSFLGSTDPDLEDVVGDSIVAVLDCLVRRGGFEGNLLGFAVTVAVNRCRNLVAWRRRQRQVPLDPLESWISNTDASALDLLMDEERLELLQQALQSIGPDCERLLRACYLEGRTIASLKDELKLQSVQVVYYRRGVCLKKAFRILNRKLGDCSSGGGPRDGSKSSAGGD
jgi:RNA polymerase sigma factor (sigma-70 family)